MGERELAPLKEAGEKRTTHRQWRQGESPVRPESEETHNDACSVGTKKVPHLIGLQKRNGWVRQAPPSSHKAIKGDIPASHV